MSPEDVIAVVPVKALSHAKSRLAAEMTDDERRRLVKAMLARVIEAVREAGAQAWTLGADASTISVSANSGAEWRREASPDINHSLSLAFKEVWRRRRAALFLPADLPLVTADDIRRIAEPCSADKLAIAIAPAQRGAGTNGLLITQPAPFRFSLGDDSFRNHLTEARRRGVEPTVVRREGLSLDLDTRDDWRRLQAEHPTAMQALAAKGCRP